MEDKDENLPVAFGRRFDLLCNVEHYCRVHHLALLRFLGVMLIFIAGGLGLAAFGLNKQVLSLSQSIIYPVFWGLCLAVVFIFIAPCRCGRVSRLNRRVYSQTSVMHILKQRQSRWILASPLILMSPVFLISHNLVFLNPSSEGDFWLTALLLYTGLLSATGGLLTVLSTFHRWSLRRMEHYSLLSDATFTLDSLYGRSHEELNELITCALSNGNTDQADLISAYLLKSVEATVE